MPPEMGVFDCPYKCPYMPLSGARLPLYTNARLNAPIRLQMPLCVMPRAMPAPKCLATRPNAPLCAQMPRARGRDCPYTRAKMHRYVRRGHNPLVFDLPVRVSVYIYPLTPRPKNFFKKLAKSFGG